MLEVTFFRDGEDRPAGIVARGHADFDAHGRDVVCAAVSAVLQAVRLGLSECAHAQLQATQQPGELKLDWQERERNRESVRAIVGTAELAIEQIAARFPKHVRVKRVTPLPQRRSDDHV